MCTVSVQQLWCDMLWCLGMCYPIDKCCMLMQFNFFFRGDDSEGSDLSVLIDQKTYLEEVNRNLK